MALYAFQMQNVLFFGAGIVIVVLTATVLWRVYWPGGVQQRAARERMRRLTDATNTMTRTLADRDQLRAEFELSKQRIEARFEEFKSTAANQLAALEKQLARKDAALKKLKAQLKDNAAAVLRRGNTRRRELGAKAKAGLRSKSPQRSPARSKAAAARAAHLH